MFYALQAIIYIFRIKFIIYYIVNMNKKGKSTVKNQLTSLINKKSINEHFHEQKGLIDYKTIDQIHTLNISNLSRESTYKSHHQNRCDNTSNIYDHKNIKKKKI